MMREAEVVERVDVSLWPGRKFCQALHICHWRDRQPVFAKLVEADIVAKTLFYVPGREAFPNDIGDIARNVVKDRSVDRHIVSKSKKSDARTDAGADDADLFITLLF